MPKLTGPQLKALREVQADLWRFSYGSWLYWAEDGARSRRVTVERLERRSYITRGERIGRTLVSRRLVLTDLGLEVLAEHG